MGNAPRRIVYGCVWLPAVWTFGAQQLDGSMLLVGDIMVSVLATVKENTGKIETKGTKIRC